MRIENDRGESIDCELTEGRRDGGLIVVIGHGVTSEKDRPYLIALADELAAAGIASLRISFTGNGDSGGRFEDATISKEVEDLGSVLDALDDREIAYAGHSMGAAVGLLRAASDDRIRALVSLAGMVHVRDFVQRHFGHLRPGVDVMLDRPHCPLSEAFVQDADRYGSLLEQAARVRVPWLLVHGTADEFVPLRDSLDARASAGGRPELIELEGSDHRFTGRVGDVTEAVVSWLVRVF